MLKQRGLSHSYSDLTAALDSRFAVSGELPSIELATPVAVDQGSSKRKTHKVLGTTSVSPNGLPIGFTPSTYSRPEQIPSGLVALPGTFIPMTPEQLEPHLTRATHILLGCRGALWKYRRSVSPGASKEEFDEDLYRYEW